jgi:hypothetical protein
MNEQRRKQWILERLKHSVQALALPAAAQLSLLPDFVVKTDELVLDFDHWRKCAVTNYRADLTSEQVESLAAMDAQIANPSGDRSVWDESSLSTHPFWSELRRLAALALNTFGWHQETPPSYAHEFISGRVDE